jgi:hypothetical protein
MSLPTLKTEPVAIVAFVEAVVILAVAFGLPVTAEQLAGIVTVLTLGLGLFARSQVSPVA